VGPRPDLQPSRVLARKRGPERAAPQPGRPRPPHRPRRGNEERQLTARPVVPLGSRCIQQKRSYKSCTRRCSLLLFFNEPVRDQQDPRETATKARVTDLRFYDLRHSHDVIEDLKPTLPEQTPPRIYAHLVGFEAPQKAAPCPPAGYLFSGLLRYSYVDYRARLILVSRRNSCDCGRSGRRRRALPDARGAGRLAAGVRTTQKRSRARRVYAPPQIEHLSGGDAPWTQVLRPLRYSATVKLNRTCPCLQGTWC
jgi:hypothetical protein